MSAYNDKFKRGRKKIKDRYAKEWFKEEVSFSSFVDLILYDIEAHWLPFILRCSYCNINYDFIGRLETWNDGVKYIIAKC